MNATEIEVIDGDSLRIDGVNHRMIGYDAPADDWRAKCVGERRRGQRATQFMRQLVSRAGKVTVVVHGLDFYNRPLATVKIGDIDLMHEMTKAGHAAPTNASRLDWCHAPLPVNTPTPTTDIALPD